MRMMRNHFTGFWVSVFVLLVATAGLPAGHARSLRIRRSATSDDRMQHSENPYDRININYDEYPMIVPKRAAILLDRIMVALHHALEDGDQEGVRRINELYKESKSTQHKNVQLPKDFQSKFVPNFNLDDDDGSSAYLDMRDINGPKSHQQLGDESQMGLQRRGHGEALGANKNRVYWRCYFNAVTCF